MSPVHAHPPVWPPEDAAQWPEVERATLARLDPERLPAHVAVIMDGNGRWARQRGLRDRNRGHEAARLAVEAVTETCAQLGVRVLTLFAFSTENWRRPKAEIAFLMRFLTRFLTEKRDEMIRNGIRLEAIGRLDDLPRSARSALEETRTATAGNRGLVLNLALSYGARDEIVRAARCALEAAAEGNLTPDELDEATFGRLLDTADLPAPDPDLLIRTSGESRISNFLLWQIAYTEIYVTPTLWPDFRRADLLAALIDYQSRERRFGRVLDPPTPEG